MSDTSYPGEQMPQTIGRFQIEETIGFGAMGAVYRAFDPLIKRTLAIKTIRLDIPRQSPQYQSFIERFYHEARISGTLSHPNIVTLFDIGEDHGLPYLAMEFIEGETIASVLDRGERFKPEKVIGLASQVASALDYAHTKGIIHRDIKPANLILSGGDRMKVTDFGIAKLVDAEMTQSGTLLGTPSYMSPEQAMGDKLDGRSDIFSLGIVCFEMLSGEQPFPGNNVTSILYKLVHVDPIEPADLEMNGLVPQKWHEIFGKVLAKKPEDRYQTAGAFVQDLEYCLGSWFGALSAEETLAVGGGGMPSEGSADVPATVILGAVRQAPVAAVPVPPPIPAAVHGDGATTVMPPVPVANPSTVQMRSAEPADDPSTVVMRAPPAGNPSTVSMPSPAAQDDSSTVVMKAPGGEDPRTVLIRTPAAHEDPSTVVMKSPPAGDDSATVVMRQPGAEETPATVLMQAVAPPPEVTPPDDSSTAVFPLSQHEALDAFGQPSGVAPSLPTVVMGLPVDLEQPGAPSEIGDAYPQVAPPSPASPWGQAPGAAFGSARTAVGMAPARAPVRGRAPAVPASASRRGGTVGIVVIGAAVLFLVGVAAVGFLVVKRVLSRTAASTSTPGVETVVSPEPALVTPPPVTVRGVLRLVSTPDGATVTVNDEPRGTTPTILDSLELGPYAVSFSLKGYDPRTERVQLTAEAPLAEIQVALNRPQATTTTANILSTPFGATVTIDGTRVGVTPLADARLRPGSRRIELAKEGYETWSQVIAVESGKVVRVDAKLKAVPKVVVAATPTAEPTVDPNRIFEFADVDVKPRRDKGNIASWPDSVGEQKRGVDVVVTIALVVNENGDVVDPVVSESSGIKAVDEAVLNAVRGSRYTAGLKKGVKVKCRTTFRQTFRRPG